MQVFFFRNIIFIKKHIICAAFYYILLLVFAAYLSYNEKRERNKLRWLQTGYRVL